MLIRFEVSNFRSIRGPAELTMVAIDNDREAARQAPMLGHKLLTRAGIYGANAAGKTNFIKALRWLRHAVAESLRVWDDEINIDQFKFGNGEDESSEFHIELLVDGVRYEYIVELTPGKVLYEALFHYPKKRRRMIFEREENHLKLQEGLGRLAGTRELLTDRVLALSIMRRFDEPLTSGFVQQLLSLHFVGGATLSERFHATASTLKWAYKDEAQVNAFLNIADLGIRGVSLEENPLEQRGKAEKPLQLLHSVGNDIVAVDYNEESHGTRSWFELIGPVLDALSKGAVLVVDELDASLHSVLSAELLKVFANEKTNPHNAQLIFTVHDTSLLRHLNRDEVWFVEKNSNGETSLTALADYSGGLVRKSQNLEKAYLAGRFGAIPEADFTAILGMAG